MGPPFKRSGFSIILRAQVCINWFSLFLSYCVSSDIQLHLRQFQVRYSFLRFFPWLIWISNLFPLHTKNVFYFLPEGAQNKLLIVFNNHNMFRILKRKPWHLFNINLKWFISLYSRHIHFSIMKAWVRGLLVNTQQKTNNWPENKCL